jgi:hypothetical protein
LLLVPNGGLQTYVIVFGVANALLA